MLASPPVQVSRGIRWLRKTGALTAVLIAATAIHSLAPPESQGATDPDNPYWPCVQRKVPHISAGMMWGGPAVDETDRSWRADGDIAGLVETLSSRRLPIEDAERRIDRFAEATTDDKQSKLTALFIGLLQRTNAERSEVISGIERFTRRQIALSEKIKTTATEANRLQSKDNASQAELARAQKLDEQLLWDTRVFDEREESLIYVCEVPVLLEQRLFALARRISEHME